MSLRCVCGEEADDHMMGMMGHLFVPRKEQGVKAEEAVQKIVNLTLEMDQGKITTPNFEKGVRGVIAELLASAREREL